MKKFALAMVCTMAMVGYLLADEFTATINKVDGNNVSWTVKGKKGGEAKTGKNDATGAKVANAKVIPGTGTGGKKGGGGGAPTYEAGDAIPDGLKNDIFAKMDEAKGVNARITTDGADGSGKITQILVIPAKAGFTGKGGGTGKKGGKKGTGRD